MRAGALTAPLAAGAAQARPSPAAPTATSTRVSLLMSAQPRTRACPAAPMPSPTRDPIPKRSATAHGTTTAAYQARACCAQSLEATAQPAVSHCRPYRSSLGTGASTTPHPMCDSAPTRQSMPGQHALGCRRLHANLAFVGPTAASVPTQAVPTFHQSSRRVSRARMRKGYSCPSSSAPVRWL